jgi:hypothetical protein
MKFSPRRRQGAISVQPSRFEKEPMSATLGPLWHFLDVVSSC